MAGLHLLMLVGGALALECSDGQKERKDNLGQPICCYTVKCNASQGFHLCRTNQGSDSCYDCDMDEFTTDMIDTADAMEQVSVCQKMPTCVKDSEYLDKTNYRCYCDRSKGFYGEADNCMRSMITCNYPGYELGNDGICVECGKDTFKSASDNSICKQKTKCKDGEIETSSGTTTTDRICTKTTSTTSAPASSTIDDRNRDGSKTWIIVGVVVGLLILVACICVVVFCYYRIKRKSIIEIFKKKKSYKISMNKLKRNGEGQPFIPQGPDSSNSGSGRRHPDKNPYTNISEQNSVPADLSVKDETRGSESQPSSDLSQTFVKSVVSSSSQTRKTSDEGKEIALPKTIQSVPPGNLPKGSLLDLDTMATNGRVEDNKRNKRTNQKPIGKVMPNVYGQGTGSNNEPAVGQTSASGNEVRVNENNENGKAVYNRPRPTESEGFPDERAQIVGDNYEEQNLNVLSEQPESANQSQRPDETCQFREPDGLIIIEDPSLASDRDDQDLPMLCEHPESATLNRGPNEADLIRGTRVHQGLDRSEEIGFVDDNGIQPESAQENLESRDQAVLQYGNRVVSPESEYGNPVRSPDSEGSGQLSNNR